MTARTARVMLRRVTMPMVPPSSWAPSGGPAPSPPLPRLSSKLSKAVCHLAQIDLISPSKSDAMSESWL